MTPEKESLVNALLSLFDMNPNMRTSMGNTSLKVLNAFLEGARVNADAYYELKKKHDDYRKRLANYESVID